MLSYVVAISKNNVIGYKGKLPWHLPADVQFFKEITSTGTKTMIMGRKTFESLPGILPGRKHIIYTQNKEYHVNDENVEIIYTLDELLEYARTADLEYFVIGGAQIFELLFPYTDRIYLTKINADFEGDTFFPEYAESDWEVTCQREGVVDENNRYPHTFFVLDRKNN